MVPGDVGLAKKRDRDEEIVVHRLEMGTPLTA
jgi:hypothetical protein